VRYIQKTTPPACFIVDTEEFDIDTSWGEFRNPCKREVHSYILKQEQNGLCCYCESRIHGLGRNESHIEHVFPQYDDGYPEKKFDYSNLVVSCCGHQCIERAVTKLSLSEKHSCGHKKSGVHNAEFFINPVEEKSTSEFFAFDKESGSIFPDNTLSKLGQQCSRYTIDVLGLDVNYLRNARKKSVKAVYAVVKNKAVTLPDVLETTPPYVTFLRHYFKECVA